jgi:CheY-like chemotaxis protein
MKHELVSLRMLVVSQSSDYQDLLRQAALASSVPIDMTVAENATSGRHFFAGGADLIFLDGALSEEEIARAVAAARAARRPPFTVLLVAPRAVVAPFAADALATKPFRLEEAKRLIERTARVRLPSRVLVVDDSSTMRSIVRKILIATRFPLDVTEVDEGLTALKLASETEYDLILMDYNMPGFTGLETLSEFKREKRRVNVVLMTSAQNDAVAERARDLGAVFLKKPFFQSDIEAVLCRFYGLLALNPQRA